MPTASDRPHNRRRRCYCEWLEVVTIDGKEVYRCHFCKTVKA